MDPYRPQDDTRGAQTCDRPDAEVYHVTRRTEDVVVAHKRREAIGQRRIHVPSEHRPHDQSNRLPTSGR